MVGKILGHYEIIEPLGAGGMGEVYRARDTTLKRDVAIKVLPERLTADEDQLARLEREAHLLAALNHPNIATIHSLEESEGTRFLVLEFVDGASLQQQLDGGPLPVEKALRVARQIAEALATAHREGIIHRDLKPANVMLTRDGRVKVLDFGIAKVVEPEQHGAETAHMTDITVAGTLIGTVPYMSPEQVRGRPADARSDIWSFGCLLYELLTGRPAFARETVADTLSAVIEHDPDFGALPSATPATIRELVAGCLDKNAANRPASSADVLRTLQDALVTPLAERAATRRRLLAAALVIGVIGIAVAIFVYQRSQVRWARTVAIPEVERLAAGGSYVDAYALATQAMERLPEDPTLLALMPAISDSLTVTTDPQGADVYLQRFSSNSDEELERVLVGNTPIIDLRIARATYRVSLEKEGFAALERVISSELNRAEERMDVKPELLLEERLRDAATTPDDMVLIDGGAWARAFPEASSYSLKGIVGMEGATLDDFFIDRYEVSNERYREFVRAGGYTDPAYWKQPLSKGGVELSFDDAMTLLVDRSGLPGPRQWSNQDFPEGKGNHPVSGISWYEAAAYAEYAGKILPTIYQWEKAARAGLSTHFEGIVMPWGLMNADASGGQRANFMGRGTAPVDSYPFGISPYGAYNMAGNVEEWLVNERGAGRVTAGGSWVDAAYIFQSGAARPAFDAADTIGFRTVSKPRAGALDQGSAPITPSTLGDLDPVDDATYRGFLSHYRYDKKPLAVELLETVETSDWTREKLTLAGFLDGDRIIAYLYLPKRVRAPYQCISYFASSTVFFGRTVAEEVEAILSPQIKAGRAVLAVVAKGAIERPSPGHPNFQARSQWGSVEARSAAILRITEYRIGLDYLATRSDIDMNRIAQAGFSLGAVTSALILTAVEPRIRSSVLIGGGIIGHQYLPEVTDVNFVTRIKVPTLVLTGRYDEEIPYEPYARTLYEMLTAPKRLELVESGHLPPVEIRNPIISAWLDETLGKVER